MNYRAILDGSRRGLGTSFLRFLLRLGSIPYRLAVEVRNFAYDAGWRTISTAEVPVISVGNITAGGTGKTPVVALLARELRRRNLRVALISRGYRSDQTGSNDEARELSVSLPDVPHLQNPDRIAAARVAVDELEMELLVLDDAFQHRRIGRNLDLVLIDATCPFGYGRLLPAGLLREPLGGLRRADLILITRAGRVDRTALETIHATLARHAPQVPVVASNHVPMGWIDDRQQHFDLASMRGKKVAAFAGIGNPAPFFESLRDLGVELVASRTLPDHAPYDRPTVEELIAWLEQLRREHGPLVAVCTHKDLVKLRTTHLGSIPLRALRIEIELAPDQAPLFWKAIDRVLESIDRCSPSVPPADVEPFAAGQGTH